MENPEPDVNPKPEPDAADVARAQDPDPLTRSEKETFEARIDELILQNTSLIVEITELKDKLAGKNSKKVDDHWPNFFHE
jgi:hypothetical protein